jgi:hypothetical protein
MSDNVSAGVATPGYETVASRCAAGATSKF